MSTLFHDISVFKSAVDEVKSVFHNCSNQAMKNGFLNEEEWNEVGRKFEQEVEKYTSIVLELASIRFTGSDFCERLAIYYVGEKDSVGFVEKYESFEDGICENTWGELLLDPKTRLGECSCDIDSDNSSCNMITFMKRLQELKSSFSNVAEKFSLLLETASGLHILNDGMEKIQDEFEKIHGTFFRNAYVRMGVKFRAEGEWYVRFASQYQSILIRFGVSASKLGIRNS